MRLFKMMAYSADHEVLSLSRFQEHKPATENVVVHLSHRLVYLLDVLPHGWPDGTCLSGCELVVAMFS